MTTTRIITATPTVFFVCDGDRLRQRVDLTIESDTQETAMVLSVQGSGLDERIPLAEVAPGRSTVEVYLPEVREPTMLTFGLWASGQLCHEATINWQPQRHWEVHLVHYSHHDLGYTDLPSNVRQEQASFLDEVVRLAEATADWPEEARFRFLIEQAWSIIDYVQSRPAAQVERLMQAIRRGQVEVSALFGNQTTELCGHEEMIRLLYPSFGLKRRYGISIASAEHNDIPGFSWGLAGALAGAGVRYFSPGIPRWYYGQGEGRVHPLWDEEAVLPLAQPGAFWWEAIDGARILLWYDLHGGEWLPTSYEQALRQLPEMLAQLVAGGYAYDMVSYTLRGGHRDNAPPIAFYAHLVRTWNERWAYPRLINATNTSYLSRFEERYGHTLKVVRGDVPGTDYAVGATSTPLETAINRNAHDQLLMAEQLATWAAALAEYDYPRAALDDAYRSTFFYDEHAWGMWHPGGPAQDCSRNEKAGFAYRAAALAHDILIKAANRLADQITLPEEGYYLTVLNSLSWERTELVRTPLRAWTPCGNPMHWSRSQEEGGGPVLVMGGAVGRALVNPPADLLAAPFDLVDLATGERVPHQLVRITDPQAAQPWAAERVAMGQVEASHLDEIVFRAENLPPAGYRTYRVLPRTAAQDAIPAPADPYVLENRFYRLEIDAHTGALVHILDKETGRELVDSQAPHGFGRLIVRHCETGAEELDHAARVDLAETGPLFTTVRLKGSVAGCPQWTREITLHHESKRIDLALRILRDSTPNLEVYCAFPFQLEEPHFRFEAPGTVIEPLRDQVPGSNTDYYAVQHWVQVSNEAAGIVWSSIDAPMAELGGLWPGYVSGAHHGVTPPGYGHPFLKPGELTRAHIYALLMYHNYRTNFDNVHPGEALFRFAFTSLGSEWPLEGAQRFGWGVANPPLAVWMKGPQTGMLPACCSFAQIDVPNVMLLALKQAEDSNDIILRLLETAGKETVATVTLPQLDILQAHATNLVEENQRLLPCTPHTIAVTLRPYATATVRLVTRSDVPPSH